MKKIIFDMGMVLVDFRWESFLEELGYHGEKKERLAKAVFQNPLWQQFDLGLMGDENIIAQMKKEAPGEAEAIDRIWDKKNFHRICRPLPYTEKLLHSLYEQGYKLYILSNYGKTLLEAERKEFTFLRYIEGGVFSWEVNQIKPNADIYETLIKKYNLDPQDMVFFDDLKANCDGARQAGITAVEVHGLSDILEGLKKYCGIELPELAEGKDR